MVNESNTCGLSKDDWIEFLTSEEEKLRQIYELDAKRFISEANV